MSPECYVYKTTLIITILFIIWILVTYIYYRIILLKYIKVLDVDDRWDKTYVKINKWIQETINDDNNNNNKNSPCQNMALHIEPRDIGNEFICKEMAEKICGIDSNAMKRVNIPPSSKTTFVAANGMHLIPGESYCVYKKPPLVNDNRNCNEIWGYWKYCPINDYWICHSKVPGVYDATRDEFNPCQREDKFGKFMIDGRVVSPDEIEKNYEPSDFYSLDFQMKCSCECNVARGFVFNPLKSRTMCFKDPCKSNLPPFSAVKGFDVNSGHCDCQPYFKNLFGDETQPCTACPYNRPEYDREKNIVTVYLKCFNEDYEGDDDDDDIKNEKIGLVPCITQEDKIRGCAKARIYVKPSNNNNNNYSKQDDDKEEGGDDLKFYDRVFW